LSKGELHLETNSKYHLEKTAVMVDSMFSMQPAVKIVFINLSNIGIIRTSLTTHRIEAYDGNDNFICWH